MESVITSTYKLKFGVSTDNQTNIKTVTIFWTIPTFSALLNNNTNLEIRTDKNIDFKKDYDEDSKFQFRIKALGGRGQLIDFYYLAPRSVLLQIKMYMSNPSYAEQYLQKIFNQDYRWVQASKWQFLTDQYKDNINFTTLHLKFQFMINIKSDTDTAGTNLSKPKLCNDFENLLNNAMFSDTIVKSNEGVEFHAHKAVLAVRSAVLKASFDHNTTESLKNVIESPFDTEVLREVLLYIYTENVPKIDEMSEELLIAADYYELNELRNLCEDKIQKMLSVENVMGVLQLAHTYMAENLKQHCFQFINDNDAKSIIKTEGWADIKSLELFKSLAEYIIRNN